MLRLVYSKSEQARPIPQRSDSLVYEQGFQWDAGTFSGGHNRGSSGNNVKKSVTALQVTLKKQKPAAR